MSWALQGAHPCPTPRPRPLPTCAMSSIGIPKEVGGADGTAAGQLLQPGPGFVLREERQNVEHQQLGA